MSTDFPPYEQVYHAFLSDDKAKQAAYDAVYEVIRDHPGTVHENARVWRAVTAALDAYREGIGRREP